LANADKPLTQQIQELQAWLHTLDLAQSGEAPGWSQVLLTDDSEISSINAEGHCRTLNSRSLRTPIEFEARWLELIAEGRRDWINLSAYGVWRNALVVVVEAPRHGVKGSYRPEQISVNFSSPPFGSDWQLSRHLVIA